MGYVNKVKAEDGTTYDIQDKRLTVSAADAGKMVAVDESGELTLVDAPSGGTKLYKHMLVINEGPSEQYYLLDNDVTPITMNNLSSRYKALSNGIIAFNGTNFSYMILQGPDVYFSVYGSSPAKVTSILDTVTEL